MAWLKNFLSVFTFRSSSRRFRELDPAAHTIKSHGAKVAKNHLHDWLILLLLVVIEVVLVSIHPFYRYVGKDTMTDLKFPFKDNTVPVWSVPLYAVILPILIFLIVYIRRRDVYDLHHAILGLLFSVLITAIITDAIKNGVGRPRPNFFWRCFPNGIEAYDRTGDVICNGKESEIREGHKSFPSGHTSWSFAGLGFLSFYLSGKMQAFDGKGHVAKLCPVLLPLLGAALVGVSRVNDYWHHWQDVFAGAIIGLVVSAFCYLQFFPPPNNDNGWGPYAYFIAQEEFHRSRDNATQAVTIVDVPIAEPTLNGSNSNNNNNNTHFEPTPFHNQTYDQMETGERR
ncbi:lipid phosphate phosphatase 2 [Cucumis sativus]|nr:lipid phosphate phosphatase 2 [Cucumis sativus]